MRGKTERDLGFDPPRKLVDQWRNVGGAIAGPQPGFQRLRLQLLDSGRAERHRFDAKAGIDFLDPHGEHPFHMSGFARGTRGADRDPLLRTIDDQAGEMRRAQPHAALLQDDDQIIDEIADHLTNGFGVPMGSSNRRSTRGDSNGTTGTIGSATMPRAWSSRRTVASPRRLASGPRGMG